MDNPPTSPHWLVTVARSAKLPGADDLSIPATATAADAWAAARAALGLSADDLARHVARHFRSEMADLDGADPHAARLLPGELAHRLGVFPLQYSDRTLVVATGNRVTLDAETEIREAAARAPDFRVADPTALDQAIARAYPAPSEDAAGTPRTTGSLRKHVLVVDDDADTRLLLRTVLESAGFAVTEAADGPEALELIMGPQRIHLVTLDLMMVQMSGLAVLREVRKKKSPMTLPVVVATGSDDPDIEMQLFEAGADDFVVKPLDPARFLLRVQAVLRRHRAAGPAIRL